MTYYKQLCAELVETWDATADFDYKDFGNAVADLVDRIRAALAQPEPEGPTEEDVERAAQHVFEAMRFSAGAPTPAPPWVEGGNSFMQDRARKAARDILNYQAS